MKGHENIINYSSTVRSNNDNSLYLVLDYCEYDLAVLINNYGLSQFQLKSYMKQLLLGLSSLHDHGYVHRDIKPSNVFVTKDNKIKLGDFGLTRKIFDNNSDVDCFLDCSSQLSRDRTMTTQIMTQSYRPPEVLLEDTNYDQSIDIWSLACVFYEMLTGKVLFYSSSSTVFSQLASILRICGSPNQENWPGFDKLPKANYIDMMQKFVPALRELLELTIPPQYHCLIDLLQSMLQLDPKKRINAHQALSHPFFNDQTTLTTQFINEKKYFSFSTSISPPPSPIQNSGMEVYVSNNPPINDDLDTNSTNLPYPEIHILNLRTLNDDEENSQKKRKELAESISKLRDLFAPTRILPSPIGVL